MWTGVRRPVTPPPARVALSITSSNAGFTWRWNVSSVSTTTSFGVCA